MKTYPYIESKIYFTKEKTPYFREPGVHLISAPKVDLSSINSFLSTFPEKLEFFNYLEDDFELPPSSLVAKFAGQLCYNSFGPKRTFNKDAFKYFENIKLSGHGSVLEHAFFTFLFYGVSRSLTHELVRHRAGFSFSQVSQRYVGGDLIRFVERPEYSSNDVLHNMFEERIDFIKRSYDNLTKHLIELKVENISLLKKTQVKKSINQCARSVLTNETEAPIVVTANARAWRHFIDLRATQFADTEIRELAVRVCIILSSYDPIIFGDYIFESLEDGTKIVKSVYKKV